MYIDIYIYIHKIFSSDLSNNIYIYIISNISSKLYLK